MVRIQLHLSSEQDRKLRALARERKTTRADLIRRAIDLLLGQAQGGDDPLFALIGLAGPGARSDVSERHDDLLYSPDPQPLLQAAEKGLDE
jgi:hypothetical protein